MGAFEIIFKRYVRMKKIVLPHEVYKFEELFLKKHPEFCASTGISSFVYNMSTGAAYVETIRHKKYIDHIIITRLHDLFSYAFFEWERKYKVHSALRGLDKEITPFRQWEHINNLCALIMKQCKYKQWEKTNGYRD